MKIMCSLKVVLINLAALIVLMLFLELVCRAFYPEFKNNIFNEYMTNGKKVHYAEYFGDRRRSPYEGLESEPYDNRNLILIFGDSITWGYGLDYEDIYWVKLQRLMDLYQAKPPRIVPSGCSANNVQDIEKLISNVLNDYQNQVKIAIYQFNFNDIYPYAREELKQTHEKWFKKISEWRYSNMNKSVFLRVLQHYLGELRRIKSGSCEARGIDALGVYSWTFGSSFLKGESEKLWEEFEDSIIYLKSAMDKKHVKFIIFVSPLLYDVDTEGQHPYYNYLNYDFSCATVSPKQRLLDIAKKHGIEVIDPTDYLKASFERRVKAGNIVPYYFNADENHFNEVASEYIAEYMMSRLAGTNN